MRASTSASQACGSTSLSFAVMISVAMMAARSAPRSEPANSHEFVSESEAAQRAFRCIVRETDAPVVDEAGEPLPTAQHVVDRSSHRGCARQPRALLAQPGFERRHERGTLLAPHLQPFFSAAGR